MKFKLVRPFVLLLAFAVCAFADEPRLALNTGGHTSVILDVIFNRDGKYLISAGYDKVIRVWEVETGRLARTTQGEIGDGDEGKIFAMALSPDDRYLAVGGYLAGERANSCAIRLHDFRSGEAVRLLKGHENVINALAFSPDGRYLVSGSSDKTARVWDLEARPMKQAHLLSGHTDDIYAVAFSPDGRRIVTGSYDYTLKLWDAASGTLVNELEKRHSDHVRSAAFSPDGRYLVSGGHDKKVLLWDGQTGDFIMELHWQETTVDSLSFSPDGGRLLTGSGWGGSNVCYALAFPSGKVMTRFGKHDNVAPSTPTKGEQPLVRARRYAPIHNIGHFRYLECSRVDQYGQPQGDLAPWDEILFPFDPALRGAEDLKDASISRARDHSRLVEEVYSCNHNGIIEVEIKDAANGFSRRYTLRRK